LVAWLEENGAACARDAARAFVELMGEGEDGSAAVEGGVENESEQVGGDENDAEGDDEDEDDEGEWEGTMGSGGSKPEFAHMTLRELEAIPRKMTKEGGRYVDPVEQLERDKEQWRRERKAIKEDRRLVTSPPWGLSPLPPIYSPSICIASLSR
jgi:hypothetical protein